MTELNFLFAPDPPSNDQALAPFVFACSGTRGRVTNTHGLVELYVS